MDAECIIGALAFITIGGVLALSIFHFGVHVKDPENLEAVKRVAADRESAATKMSSESAGGRSLRQRLNDAPGINDRLSNRPEGLGLWDAVFGTPWSAVRSTVTGIRGSAANCVRWADRRGGFSSMRHIKAQIASDFKLRHYRAAAGGERECLERPADDAVTVARTSRAIILLAMTRWGTRGDASARRFANPPQLPC